jgi:tetratricopeptide (TPR) repeat protein
MKILLFNLGPIQNRIIAWEVEGFKSLFEQDIILWGPIPDTKFTYKDKEIPILNFFGQTTIKDVFDRLPENWYPEIVVCDTSVLNYIQDIYMCPVKTILLTRDAWSDTIFNRKLVELFDFINYGVIDRALYNSLQVNLLPLSNCAVSLPPEGIENARFEDREIDVIAIANYDKLFYHDRYRTLYKLSDLNNSGLSIKYVFGIDRPQIYTYYQRSKIVIDWAHTLSNRSFEAALNGCLLFSHEDNKLIRDFWIPWEEYIPYNESNLMELLKFYLKNPDEAKKVIKNSHAKIQTIPSNYGQMIWEDINEAVKREINIQDRINRIKAIPPAEVIHRSATAFLYNYRYQTNYPEDWKIVYFERIDKVLSYPSKPDARIIPLIEAARMAFLLKKNDLAVKYLNELGNVFPEYAWTSYLRARIYYDKNDYKPALLSLQKAIDCATESPELIRQYILPVIEKGNTCDARRITDYLWEAVYNHRNEFQVKALLNLSFELCGNAYLRINEPDNAKNAYIQSIENVPIPDCVYKVGPLLINSGKFEKLNEIVMKGRENSPYDSILIFYHVYAMIHLKQKNEARKLLMSHRNALKSFIGVRKLTFIRYAIIVIWFSIFAGQRLGSAAISQMINFLKKRLPRTYLD